MRRFGRWMFNGLTVLSLVLLAMVGIAYILTFHSGAYLEWNSKPKLGTEYLPERYGGQYRTRVSQWSVSVNVSMGWMFFDCSSLGCASVEKPDDSPGLDFERSKVRTVLPEWHFVWRRVNDLDHGGVDNDAILSCWAVATFLAILPLAWFAELRIRRRARRNGFCQKCGYNLTGNVSGVCPECGTVIKKVVQSK
jgi:hypothetical protein